MTQQAKAMSPIRGGGVDTMKARLHPSAFEFGRYFVVSLIALGADILVLLAAAKVMHYLLAAAMAFIVGAVISYLLATRWAFRRRRLNDRAHAEFAIYALVGLFGLGVNELTIFVAVSFIGAPLLAGKLAAAGLTFCSNFIIRKLVLF